MATTHKFSQLMIRQVLKNIQLVQQPGCPNSGTPSAPEYFTTDDEKQWVKSYQCESDEEEEYQRTPLLKPFGPPGTFVNQQLSSLAKASTPMQLMMLSMRPPKKQMNFASRQEMLKYIENFRLNYKTELCRNWLTQGFCPFAQECAYAHGHHELCKKHPMKLPNKNYKTKMCKKWHEITPGQCSYGDKCQFIHDEIQDQERIERQNEECWKALQKQMEQQIQNQQSAVPLFMSLPQEKEEIVSEHSEDSLDFTILEENIKNRILDDEESEGLSSSDAEEDLPVDIGASIMSRKRLRVFQTITTKKDRTKLYNGSLQIRVQACQPM